MSWSDVIALWVVSAGVGFLAGSVPFMLYNMMLDQQDERRYRRENAKMDAWLDDIRARIDDRALMVVKRPPLTERED